MSGQRAWRAVDWLLANNPDMRVVPGGKHLKIYMGDHMIAVMSRSLHRDKLSPKLVSQLRRGGVQI